MFYLLLFRITSSSLKISQKVLNFDNLKHFDLFKIPEQDYYKHNTKEAISNSQ